MITANRLDLALPEQGTAIALGFFDGIHRGHREVIERAVAMGDRGLTPMVFTFTTRRGDEPVSKAGQALIQTEAVKERLLEQMGVAYLLCPDFADFRTLSPAGFVELLAGRFHAKYLCCGENFRFGQGAAAGPAELRALCAPLGIEVEVLPLLLDGGEPISSTRIRQELLAGNMEEANRLLGHPFTLIAEVVHGAALGRTFGCPTTNQNFAPGQIIPRNGVYATLTYIDGKAYVGATNVGRKPTVDGKEVLAETYLLGLDRSVYGQVLPVEFYHFLRPEKKFTSLQELGAAIQANAREAQALLAARVQ